MAQSNYDKHTAGGSLTPNVAQTWAIDIGPAAALPALGHPVVLTLNVDPTHDVAESNESNNRPDHGRPDRLLLPPGITETPVPRPDLDLVPDTASVSTRCTFGASPMGDLIVPSRRDLDRLVVWCDAGATEPPFQWLGAKIGAALTVHGMTPSGDVVGGVVAMWKGRIRMRATSGISELPAEPVRFEGTLAGVRNPAKTVQLTTAADSDSLTVALAGATLPGEWTTRFDVAHIEDTAGVVRADWTLAPANAAPTHLFELALWPDLDTAVDLGPP